MSRSRWIEVTTGDGQRTTLDLSTLLDPERAERAATAANAWIKALRHLPVDADEGSPGEAHGNADRGTDSRADAGARPLRDRFTYRGDSLWWFAELYLHKQGVILDLWETALALDALAARERPIRVRALDAGDPVQPTADPATMPEARAADPAHAHGTRTDTDAVLALLLPQAAEKHGFRIGDGADDETAGRWAATRLAAGAVRSADQPVPVPLDRARWRTTLLGRAYTWSALASRLHPRRLFAARAAVAQGGVLAFVHSAFWRPAPGAGNTREVPADASAAVRAGPSDASGVSDQSHETGVSDASSALGASRAPAGSTAVGAPAPDGDGEEGYIGAVLRELRTRADVAPLRLVGVGPRTNFRARRWWHPVRSNLLEAPDLPLTAIEDLASWPALAGSRRVWRDRQAIERALLRSAALRAHAQIEGYDVWPIVAAELRGVAHLQFPWSARAMDEAAAVLDACRPRVIVTYAEAGGWGRALMLEARRRGIPSVGLQHGFIYRHWLNYLHAADEMQPSPHNPADRGFPRPDLTLVYDEGAARHLRTEGQFPAEAVRVTGSPSLDALAAAVSAVTDETRAHVRAQLGAAPDDRLVLVVSKFTQIGPALPGLVAAVRDLDGVRLVIKPHPAETAAPYARLAAGAPRVTMAPSAMSLAALLASARLVVTVNSTVAIDAMPLGVPALIVLLPNNLSPFVEAGAMAGGTGTGAPAGAAAADGPALRDLLAALTRDEACHAALAGRARAFAAAHGIGADGRAAARAAEAIAALAGTGR